MTYILCKGKTWFMVGPTTRVNLEGKLPERLYARDIYHYIPGQYGDFAGRNLEWHGDGLASVGMDGRLTMATISAELSAELSLSRTMTFWRVPRGSGEMGVRAGHPDADAEYEAVITVDLTSLEPQVVKPGRVAWNWGSVGEVAGQKVDQAFIGSCANGRAQ